MRQGAERPEIGGAFAWGLGCALEVVVLVVIATSLTHDQLTSLFVYMMALAIPMAIARHVFFTDSTPSWLRVFLGPAGMVACILAAVAFPMKFPASGGDSEGESQVGCGDPAPVPAPAAPETTEAVLAELDSLVGLEAVKAEIHKLVNIAKVNEARLKQGLKVPPMTYHMVFTGNPGTGKTTVARLVARAFRSLGLVSKGHLVEVDRSGLVGRYAGETAVKTSKKIDAAIGGVLFIDEAYQLAAGDGDDYGREAVATLLKRMEDDRDKFVVIAAGYTDEMRGFLDSNSGLRSRFAHVIEFADYTDAELASIFRSMAKKNQFSLAPDLDAGLGGAIARLTKKRDRTFGNARFVRQLFEDATGRQANRIAAAGTLSGDALTTLTLADLGLDERKVDVRAPSVEEVLAELDSLTGLADVKDAVRKLVATARANKLRAEKGKGAACR